jgi:hydrogenase maturation protein HypF
LREEPSGPPGSDGSGPGGRVGPDETALEIHVRGVVQGVGFRPFVHRLALRQGLAGWVRNEAGEVRIRVQGGAAGVEGFLRALPSKGPPLARIDSMETQSVDLELLHDFQVAPSPPASEGRLPVSPDVAICGACEKELRDPSDRRFRYPFITCTDCGPRFTVIQELPYDRVRTSMGVFTQCPACQAEYRDPGDRRYHAETNSCPDCGPRIWLEEGVAAAPEEGPPGRPGGAAPVPDGSAPPGQGGGAEPGSLDGAWAGGPVAEGTDAALKGAAELLAAGGILAIRGLGGFHLAVDATNDGAVRRLRDRKGRDEKPLAVMARDLDHARSLGRVGPEEERLLSSGERPIVLLELGRELWVAEGPARGPALSLGSGDGASTASGDDSSLASELAEDPSPGLAPSVAPGLETVGIMLPYTPLHHLIMDALAETHGRKAREEAVAETDGGRGREEAVVEARCGGAREEALAEALARHGPAVPVPLVVTSGNASDEPIATGNQEARERLRGIADAFLLHDREIVARCDDSVVRVLDGAPAFIRRARGYAPLPVSLPFPCAVPILGVGPHLKNTFALAHGESVFVSQHIGDLETLETLEHFKASLARFRTLFRLEPEVVVRDLHPGYLSTRLARELAEEWGLPGPLVVQHHHAHVAAVAAEHGVEGPVVGVAFDGTGYGDDGAVWGGEVLVADLGSYRRVGQLRYAPMPGGEAAIRNPWRMALGYASLEGEGGLGPGLGRLPLPGGAAGGGSPGLERMDREAGGVAAEPAMADGTVGGRSLGRALEGIPEREAELALTQIRRGINAPLTSSMGRLFDGAAAVLGLRRHAGYEGQAAMELEGAARRGGRGEARNVRAAARGGTAPDLPFPFQRNEDGLWLMDPLPLLGSLGERARRGEAPEPLALAFHRAVAVTTSAVVAEVCEGEGLDTVALGGGVFQNALLTGLLARRLRALGLRVLYPRALGPNDGAISYGQVAVAAARIRNGETD